MRSLKKADIAPLVIILLSIISIHFIFRIGAYLVMNGILPFWLFASIGNFRIHHFVYGNILITSFIAIGLGIKKHKNWFALFYGIGLGLVLDEFLLWVGDIKQLTSNVIIIPYSFTIIAVVTLIIASIIMIRLYKLHPGANLKKHKK